MCLYPPSFYTSSTLSCDTKRGLETYGREGDEVGQARSERAHASRWRRNSSVSTSSICSFDLDHCQRPQTCWSVRSSGDRVRNRRSDGAPAQRRAQADRLPPSFPPVVHLPSRLPSALIGPIRADSSMSDPPSASPLKRQYTKRTIEDIARVRGALAGQLELTSGSTLPCGGRADPLPSHTSCLRHHPPAQLLRGIDFKSDREERGVQGVSGGTHQGEPGREARGRAESRQAR